MCPLETKMAIDDKYNVYLFPFHFSKEGKKLENHFKVLNTNNTLSLLDGISYSKLIV